MSEPREWWIEVKSFSGDILAAYSEKPDVIIYRTARDVIHVIEKSAYDSLKADAEKLVELSSRLLERIDHNGGIGEYNGGPASVVGPLRKAIEAWRAKYGDLK